MLFDRKAFTLTRDLTDCDRCRFTPGTVATEKPCPKCEGTGNGPRGGARGCRMCHGFGKAYDQEHRSTCPKCHGAPQRVELESWTDHAPAEAVGAMQLRVARQDRDTSWNEQYLGLGCLWSSTDYGKAWDRTDIEVLSDVREQLLNGRTQASKLLAVEYDRDALTLPIVRGLVVVVSRNGYSVRPDTALAESRAEREPDSTTAHIIGAAVYNAGGNGTLAAALGLPECQDTSHAGRARRNQEED